MGDKVSTSEIGIRERAEAPEASQKTGKKRKAKNEKFGVSVSEDGFEVPFDLIVGSGFGGGLGARA